MAKKKKSIWNCIFVKLLKKWILLERENRKLRKLVSHDPLTGALSREEFKERVEYFLSLSKRFSKNKAQKCFSIVFIDIDKFKDVNDTYGHQAGDNILTNFTNFLKDQLRESDLVGRISGDEFVLFLEEDDLESGKKVMKKIQSILSLSLMS
ncbi:diguanylate cyclase/phosphodiesterase (GGDEF & EAL domains) with PAS/PAC sensor(s), partial [hydrothermal vent metagenome]